MEFNVFKNTALSVGQCKSFIQYALLVSCIVGFSSQASAVEKDKKQHFIAGAVISAGATYFTYETEHPIIYATLVGTGAGLAKEIYDSRSGGTGFDGRDLAATAIGAYTGALIGYGVGFYVTDKSAGITYHHSF